MVFTVCRAQSFRCPARKAQLHLRRDEGQGAKKHAAASQLGCGELGRSLEADFRALSPNAAPAAPHRCWRGTH